MFVLSIILASAAVVVSFVIFMSRFENDSRSWHHTSTIDTTSPIYRHIFNQKFNLYDVSERHSEKHKDS